HYIEPYIIKSARPWDILVKIVEDSYGSRIIANTGDYLYAEFTTKIMGFVDDVEFVRDEANQHIDVRSASRMGESDLGTNRKRLETIRNRFDDLNQEVSQS
ncbi:MAG: DUF1499 domain-containing protein, partial [Jaaginema sp. PMC 1079.18]|nr:DUF1499 domain-containing protein [Jaaginema sp. PMC 1079.18]